MSITKTVFVALFCFVSFFVASQDVPMWKTDKVKQRNGGQTYTATMHTKFGDLINDYRVGGSMYYRGTLDSFGYKEALNYEQELIICTPQDISFSKTVEKAYLNSKGAVFYVKPGDFGVKNDITNTSLSPSVLQQSIHDSLKANQATTSKGRFCYDLYNYSGRVDYRTAGAESAVYCKGNQVLPSFYDEASGQVCTLKLDIDLKVGETRFVRQPQGNGFSTIGQGFIGCYKNASGYGQPYLELVQNPSTCTKNNRGTCNHTCDWAEKVVCDAKDMPKWGGFCVGTPTTIFQGDSLVIDSAQSLSVDPASGDIYSGQANMSCNMISGKAQWVVGSSSCTVL